MLLVVAVVAETRRNHTNKIHDKVITHTKNVVFIKMKNNVLLLKKIKLEFCIF
jgi:hypothetical protein